MVKSALYKHYKNKRDVLDSIVQRMQEKDYENANEHSMPENTIKVMPEKYKDVSIESVKNILWNNSTIGQKKIFPQAFVKCLHLSNFVMTNFQNFIISIFVLGQCFIWQMFLGRRLSMNKMLIN